MGPAIAARPFDRNNPAARAEVERGRIDALKNLQLSHEIIADKHRVQMASGPLPEWGLALVGSRINP